MAKAAKNTIRVAILGVGGKMGSTVLQIMDEQIAAGVISDICVVAGVESSKFTPADTAANVLGQLVSLQVAAHQTAPLVRDVAALKDVVGNVDVVIDFSTPAASLAGLALGATQGLRGWVIGTTGFSAAEELRLQRLAEQLTIVRAGNFSAGIFALLSLVQTAVKLLGPAYDLELVETHHRAKRDAPSGTAKMLAAALNAARGAAADAAVVTGRAGTQAKRNVGEIGIAAVRGGGVIGEHEVHFLADNERVTLRHTAFNRAAFVSAVPAAVRFAAKKARANVWGVYPLKTVMAAAEAGNGANGAV